MLEGADQAPPEQWRDYLLAHEFGYTPQEIDDAPAVRLDWLLACHDTVVRVQHEQQEKARRA